MSCVFDIVASIASAFIPASRGDKSFEILTLPNQLSLWTPNTIVQDEEELDDQKEAASL